MLPSHWNTLKLLWTFVKESYGSECFLFHSSEAGRELGGGSLGRPKATSGVRAGRDSELRRDGETGDAATWVGKSKQSCLGGEEQTNIQ